MNFAHYSLCQTGLDPEHCALTWPIINCQPVSDEVSAYEVFAELPHLRHLKDMLIQAAGNLPKTWFSGSRRPRPNTLTYPPGLDWSRIVLPWLCTLCTY